MLWRLGIYIHKHTQERARIEFIHQKNGNYVLRYLDQRKIETISEREFSVNWRHEEGEEEQKINNTFSQILLMKCAYLS